MSTKTLTPGQTQAKLLRLLADEGYGVKPWNRKRDGRWLTRIYLREDIGGAEVGYVEIRADEPIRVQVTTTGLARDYPHGRIENLIAEFEDDYGLPTLGGQP